jgi:hypothetical protein
VHSLVLLAFLIPYPFLSRLFFDMGFNKSRCSLDFEGKRAFFLLIACAVKPPRFVTNARSRRREAAIREKCA